MKRLRFAAVMGLTIMTMSNVAFSEEFGSVEEAKSMLLRAIDEVKSDKLPAFGKFNANAPGFRDRDLFVFCFRVIDGKFTAHEAFVTLDVRNLRDPQGTAYGEKMFAAAKEGQITEVLYVSPFPGTSWQVPKRAFVSRIDDHVCGVSAYLYNGPYER